jgi:hypothetical protein
MLDAVHRNRDIVKVSLHREPADLPLPAPVR